MSLRDMLQVLVVDDMSTSRALITQALDWMGVQNYSTQNDGAAALAQLQQQPVHLVISDFNMPNMDGLTLLQGLRQNPATRGIGFILVTGRADAATIQRGQQLGMNNFIQKPFEPPMMRSCIEQVVGRL